MHHNVVYQLEPLADVKEEMEPILYDHWQEIGLYKEHCKLKPDWERYYTVEKAGVLKIITARDDGVLVGYFVALVTPGLHYCDNVYAVNDVVYLKDSYRDSLVGLEMFKYAEEYFKTLGVDVISIHMKTALPFDSLCEGLGYDYVERLYTKYIGG